MSTRQNSGFRMIEHFFAFYILNSAFLMPSIR